LVQQGGEKVKVASIQLEIKDNERKENRFRRVKEIISQLPQNVDLVILPECWNIGYFAFDKYSELAETADGPTVSMLAQLAKKFNLYILIGSFIEKQAGKLFNTSLLLDRQGQCIATYRKIHLFGFGSEESKLLAAGREVVVVKTELGVFGLSTCYDLRFPELYRQMVDQGAEIFLVSSAWPFPRIENWVALNQVRALENQAYLISSNCCGVNYGKQFLGRSLAVDPWGIVIAGAGYGYCLCRCFG
jgi:predicted amidohydrolase